MMVNKKKEKLRTIRQKNNELEENLKDLESLKTLTNLQENQIKSLQDSIKTLESE
jgi:hypothetical protein